MSTIPFWKYHALENDYLIVPLADLAVPDLGKLAEAICARHSGIGGDGVLFIPQQQSKGLQRFPLRIFNPDGSEAEKSGNGCRILAAHLWLQGWVASLPFRLLLPTEEVEVLHIDQPLRSTSTLFVTLDMGHPQFESPLPQGETLRVAEQELQIFALSVGNPHCVLFRQVLKEEELMQLGPAIEHHPRFPQRTNVQFVEKVADDRLKMLVWERGAGFTQASGSSATAAAALALALGNCHSPLTVEMPGGSCVVERRANGRCWLTGPVSQVGQGDFFTPA